MWSVALKATRLRRYFGVPVRVSSEKSGFTFNGRNRRLPRDGGECAAVFYIQYLKQGYQRCAAKQVGSAGCFCTSISWGTVV